MRNYHSRKMRSVIWVQKIKEVNQENALLSKRVESLQTQCDKLNANKQSLEATIKEKDVNIEEMMNNNKALAEENDKMKNRDKQLEMTLERRNDQIKELRTQNEKQKSTIWRMFHSQMIIYQRKMKKRLWNCKRVSMIIRIKLKIKITK